MKKGVKPKKRAKPIDVFALFCHAYRIWGADLHLRRIESPEHVLMIAQGSLILNAFAAELFLKCLLILDTGDAPTSHRLDVLFRQLKHKRKRRAEELWNEHCRPKIENQARHFGNPIDLPNAIVACRDAFERLRYHYEDPQKALYYLNDLPLVLGRVILEIKPEWHQPALQDRVPPPSEK